MELLIPGLILVALMAYASTRIKKRAAEAFNEEQVENERYTLTKPDGFLHVLGDTDHDFMAYSKEFGEHELSQLKRATIEIDVINGSNVQSVVNAVRESATDFSMHEDDGTVIKTDEQANETEFRAVYKIIADTASVYRLRFAVLSEHFDEYVRRIDDTIDSFTTKHA